ncbi:MAG: hypothetical protein VB048_01280 [Bacteroidaceae bacterium]|jgi:uncharacterized membrane protein|nr:hypothetical protein [Bacteroidales bacterium]MEA4966736.1 hypothetical protein [Bacteroidaceae bacterium]MEA5099301.1 hypothetical protein [Bacteroidales bacterium]
MKKIKIQKSIKLLIMFSIALMITLVIIDNNYYANNKDKVEKNRKNLKYTQIGTMEMMNWRGNIKVSKRQLIDVGIILDSTQTDEDKVYKN